MNRIGIVAVLCAACGGSSEEVAHLPYNSTVHMSVARTDVHPTFQCAGTVDTNMDVASFDCTAEGFAPWRVLGWMSNEARPDGIQVHVYGLRNYNTEQPDIAAVLLPNGERFAGAAVVILPDGTETGHAGATAEAWIER